MTVKCPCGVCVFLAAHSHRGILHEGECSCGRRFSLVVRSRVELQRWKRRTARADDKQNDKQP